MKPEATMSKKEKWIITEGKYDNGIEPFDVIKELENLFGFSANIPLLKESDS